ncbi:MAG TPA: c-type cytochrome [Roseovarius sp.]
MKTFGAIAAAAALILAAPAFAATEKDEASIEAAMTAPGGDATTGEAVFAKQCVTCHVVETPDGETLAGKRGRLGPNLYGILGGPVSAVADFRYGKSMVDAGETDAEWTEEDFVAYLQDPTGWLRETLDDSDARSKMAWKVSDPQDAADLYAYLQALAPYKPE